ncbi:MAG: phospholipase D-like domain-containing protein, partial [Phormidesmis sp.]
PRDKTGRHGSLHMKVAIADRQHLFITSANLTHYALSLNMEMGLLVHSKTIACQVSEHLDQLIQQSIISSLETRDDK